MPDDNRLVPIPETGMVRAGSLVIDLADYKIAAGRTPHNSVKCQHTDLVYSEYDRLVWCNGCQRNVDGFDAFMLVANNLHRMNAEIAYRRAKLEQEAKINIISRAAKALDKMWRGSGKAVPCPHCRGGLLPEDFADGKFGHSSRELELARRKRSSDAGSDNAAWR